MAVPCGFPSELKNGSAEEKLTYFKGYTVRHRLIQEAYVALMDAIREPADASLIYVFGPSGVGKTTVLLRVEKELMMTESPNTDEHRGRIPVVRLEAIAPDTGNYSWKAFYKDGLRTLEHPFVDHKSILYGKRGLYRDKDGNSFVGAQQPTKEALRQAYEEAIRHRRPAAILIDEAQHLTMVSGGRKLKDQMDVVKSLANRTSTVHVLVGTYDLLRLLNRSGQLARRSIKIHLRRYREDCEEDVQEFINIIGTFQRQIPVVKEPDLVSHWRYLLEQSLGCVGILKSWLVQALNRAIKEGAQTLTLAHLEPCERLPDELNELEIEVTEGEADLAERAQRRTIRSKTIRPDGKSSEADNPAANGRHRPQPACAPRRRAGLVGQRHPTRDPVGVTRPEAVDVRKSSSAEGR